jgi:hypothetical protein
VTAITPVQGLLLCLLLAWKAAHLARAPRNVPLRCVVACLAFAAVAFLAQLPNPSLVSPANRWLVLTQFALVLATSTALDFFFLFSALGTAGARRLAVRRAIVMAAVAAAMAVAVAPVPPGASIRDQSVPAVAVLYLLFMAANGTLLADALRWTRRGIADAEPILARGLRITSAGLALLIAALAPLTVMVALRWARLPASPVLLTAGVLIAVPGIVLFLIGVGYPGTVSRLAAVRVYASHWRLYRKLAPLWHELHRAYPQDSLARVPASAPASAWREALSLREVHRRFYRRVVECRDGLVRVSPRLAPGDPQQEAERLLDALRTIPAARKAPGQTAGHAVPIAVPAGPGLDADAAALATLSHQITAARRAQAAAPPSPEQQENP